MEPDLDIPVSDPSYPVEIAERPARRVRAAMQLGAWIGLAICAGGLALTLGTATGALRNLAELALLTPVVIYVGWWLVFSGLWARPVADADGDSHVMQVTVDAIAQVFDGVGADHASDDATWGATIRPRAVTVSDVDRAILRRSVSAPGARDDSGVAARQLRPRFRRAG